MNAFVFKSQNVMILMLLCYSRDDDLDVEVSASGFTKEMADSFDEVHVTNIHIGSEMNFHFILCCFYIP